ncbi:protein FLX-like 3 [Actinidia eriantha]|uniref:protein FLX-like 3 n=1 Tax=Actinidia eriantha TaxID=165200 RepID=UPI0025902FAA|nr:protein FLX-like 3 [Actinidia eriantha]XP_057477256.1 protein FLX-like 3 [Actinidia eriantha]XP_057477257.1 protein FLX-like 3 [Actinidia eriantha]XP_057477258.1 protein FLX-like 3 [Actinidia eriantha]
MAGRNRLPRQPEDFRGFRDGPRPVMHRGPGPFPLPPAALEEELEIQYRDMQRILAENRHMIDENVIMQRELAAAKDEIHRLGQIIPNLRADREVQARELIERGLKLEAELRTVEPLRTEVIQLRAEAQKLNALRQDMSSQVQTLTNDLTRLKAENKQVDSLKADIDGLHKELLEVRRAFEYEKKANEEQVEQKQAMEKNLVSMAREIEKLRAEELSVDRRARGLGAGGYGMLNGSPEMRYAGSAYGDIYGGGAWGSYDKRGPPRR